MQSGIAQLEALFAASKTDERVLKQLERELQYRQVPRAVALLAEVQAAMYGATPVNDQTAPPAQVPAPVRRPQPLQPLQPDLWRGTPAVPAVPARMLVQTPLPPIARGVPPERAGVAVPSPRALSAPTSPTGAGSAMSVDDAYKVLKATPGSTWESIEQTRRQMVQLAHPERLASMNAEKRVQAQAEARRVNAAYGVLLQRRATGS